MQKFFIQILFLWVLASNAYSLTFEVTSATCSGPGSFQEAVAAANSNPGPDTVVFKTDVVGVQDAECGLIGADPSNANMAQVTDELVIEGNGHSITGRSRWITPDGVSNVPGNCPSDIVSTILSNPVGLIGLENNVKVTVNNLSLKGLRSIALLRDETDLTLNGIKAERTFDFYGQCNSGAIALISGANQNVTINDSVFTEAWNKGFVRQGSPDGNQFWGNAYIAGFNSAGTLSISNSRFAFFAVPVIDWDGTANIETTRFEETGFMNIRGGTATVVNSLFMGDRLDQDPQQRIMASDGGSITLEASTIAVALLDCDAVCQNTTGPGLLIATNNASIELKASAISVGLLSGTPHVLIREATGGNVTATAAPSPNWVQPVPAQNAAALRAILDQDDLLTDAPGLPNVFSAKFFYEAATPLLDDGSGTPGLLIDSVTDADTTNVLVSPIDGSAITKDIFGNPRTEALGTVRNIGAVQLGLAPTLNLTATGDASVHLNWTRPLDPVSGAITSYEVCFGTGTVPDPSALGTDCKDGDGNVAMLETISTAPDTLAGQVTSLTNGGTYWFLVRGVNDGGGGPWSNTVTAMPATVPGPPIVGATPGDGLVALTWSSPTDDGGLPVTSYAVRYRESGSSTWIVWPHTGSGTTANIGGLTNGVDYEFAVNAINALGSGPEATTIATPQAPLFLQYASPAQISEGNLLTLYPTFGNLVGTPEYAFAGSVPPAWLSIDPMTGIVSGTAPDLNAGDYTVIATVQLTRSGPPADTATTDIVIQVLDAAMNPYLNYLNYTGPAGTAVSITPTVVGLTPPLTFSNTNSNLPPGLSIIDPARGVIGRTPTTVGFWNAEMRVEKDSPPHQQQNDAAAITITPTLAYPAVGGTVGTVLSVLPIVPPLQDGASYSYALAGSLPPGLSFDPATGEISGTPTSALSSPVDVTVSVALPTGTFAATTHVGLTIQDYTITFTYPQQVFTIDQPFSLVPTVSGTIGTTVYAVDGGVLPAGVTLDPNTGEISGTMTTDLSGSILQVKLTDEFSSARTTAGLQGAPAPLEGCYTELVVIPTGTVFSGAGATIQSEVGIVSGGQVLVQAPHDLILEAPYVGLNKGDEVEGDPLDQGQGAQLSVIINPAVSCF